jgi:hypothetical protein
MSHITLSSSFKKTTTTHHRYDYAFDEKVGQAEIFKIFGRDMVTDVILGYNCSGMCFIVANVLPAFVCVCVKSPHLHIFHNKQLQLQLQWFTSVCLWPNFQRQVLHYDG